MSIETFYLATCQDCAPVLPQPFYIEAEREEWTAAHRNATGHEVTLAMELRIHGTLVPGGVITGTLSREGTASAEA